MKNKFKCCLCLRGFKEDVDPRSNAPTAARESLKIFLAIVGNEDFEIECIDVTSAFLQGQTLAREVFVTPPLEV